MSLFFENVKTKKRYELVGGPAPWDGDPKVHKKGVMVVWLKGVHSTFTEEYSVERFKNMGYRPVQVDAAA